MKMVDSCPCCGNVRGQPFYELPDVPTNSCLLIDSRAEALAFPTAPLRLCWCESCGFIYNAAWEPERTVYSDAYEETQGFSATFNAFQDRLARDLVERHDLRGKTVAEIGCGKGEFLALLCREGDNRGLGFDPGVHPERLDPAVTDRVEVVADYFGDHSGALDCDFLACKMTLEHIPDVGNFLGTVRRALADAPGAVVFFQVPDADRILEDVAFYDIYYEHCSYFSAGSLAAVFRRAGFDVARTWTDYGGQYLMIEATPADPSATPSAEAKAADKAAAARLKRDIDAFVVAADRAIADWRARLTEAAAAGRKVVVWGSGSKAVSLLTTVGAADAVTAVADINPYRQGRFMPVTGHRIASPDEVAALDPDLVIVMNPLYREEVAADLRRRSCEPEIITV